MVRMRYQIARWVMAHHAITGVICGLITIFFAIGLRNVRIKPIFVDLLPRNDLFVQLRGVKTTTDVNRLSPLEYIQATKRNRGLAKIYAKSNIVTANGRPWIDGNPFPDPNSAIELFAALTLSWGRHDASFSAIKEYNLAVIGNVEFLYESGWAERSAVARVSIDPNPYWPAHEAMLRYQSIFFFVPQNVRGTSFLNLWSYGQSTIPKLYGYLPEFRRIREFPANPRFERMIPGSTLYLFDARAAGDPLNTWGSYCIVARGPCLAAVFASWNGTHPNWEHTTRSGPKGRTFWDTNVELVPEAIIVEAEPVRFPRAPASKKRVWIDARTILPIAIWFPMTAWGEPYRSLDGVYSLYEYGEKQFMEGAYPYWSWAHAHAFDVLSGRMCRLEQVRTISGGYATSVNDAFICEHYLTPAALMRLGNA